MPAWAAAIMIIAVSMSPPPADARDAESENQKLGVIEIAWPAVADIKRHGSVLLASSRVVRVR